MFPQTDPGLPTENGKKRAAGLPGAGALYGQDEVTRLANQKASSLVLNSAGNQNATQPDLHRDFNGRHNQN